MSGIDTKNYRGVSIPMTVLGGLQCDIDDYDNREDLMFQYR